MKYYYCADLKNATSQIVLKTPKHIKRFSGFQIVRKFKTQQKANTYQHFCDTHLVEPCRQQNQYYEDKLYFYADGSYAEYAKHLASGSYCPQLMKYKQSFIKGQPSSFTAETIAIYETLKYIRQLYQFNKPEIDSYKEIIIFSDFLQGIINIYENLYLKGKPQPKNKELRTVCNYFRILNRILKNRVKIIKIDKNAERNIHTYHHKTSDLIAKNKYKYSKNMVRCIILSRLIPNFSST